MAQAFPRGELLRGRVLGHVLVERLADEFAFGRAVLGVGIEELGGSGDGFGRPAFRPVCDVLHDGLHQEQEERMARGRRHPCVGDRVVKAVVGAHTTEEGLSPTLVHIVGGQRTRLRVGHCRHVVCLEEVVGRENAFDVEIGIDTRKRRKWSINWTARDNPLGIAGFLAYPPNMCMYRFRTRSAR